MVLKWEGAFGATKRNRSSFLPTLGGEGAFRLGIKKKTDFFPKQEAEQGYSFGIRMRLIISDPEMANRITIGCSR